MAQSEERPRLSIAWLAVPLLSTFSNALKSLSCCQLIFIRPRSLLRFCSLGRGPESRDERRKKIPQRSNNKTAVAADCRWSRSGREKERKAEGRPSEDFSHLWGLRKRESPSMISVNRLWTWRMSKLEHNSCLPRLLSIKNVETLEKKRLEWRQWRFAFTSALLVNMSRWWKQQKATSSTRFSLCDLSALLFLTRFFYRRQTATSINSVKTELVMWARQSKYFSLRQLRVIIARQINAISSVNDLIRSVLQSSDLHFPSPWLESDAKCSASTGINRIDPNWQIFSPFSQSIWSNCEISNDAISKRKSCHESRNLFSIN